METIYQGHVPLARDRQTSKGCLEVALRASRGTAIISLILISIYQDPSRSYLLLEILLLLATFQQLFLSYLGIGKALLFLFFIYIKQLLQRERRAQLSLHFLSLFLIQAVVQQQVFRSLYCNIFPKASAFFIYLYYSNKGSKIALSQFQLKEGRSQLFRISILWCFKRKGIASFTDPSIVFSFTLILLLVILPLFQYLFSCYSPYIG